jgi:hypothetical protein
MEDKSISFDVIIDFKIQNKEEVYKEIYDEVQNKYKDYKVDIAIDASDYNLIEKSDNVMICMSGRKDLFLNEYDKWKTNKS